MSRPLFIYLLCVALSTERLLSSPNLVASAPDFMSLIECSGRISHATSPNDIILCFFYIKSEFKP